MIKKRLYRGSKDIPFHIELVQLKEIEKEANGPHCSPEKKVPINKHICYDYMRIKLWSFICKNLRTSNHNNANHELDGKTMIKLVNIYFEDQRSLDLKMCICGFNLNENQISV